MPTHLNGYKCSQAKDSCGIEVEWYHENKVVEKESVKRGVPQVAMVVLRP